MYYQTLSDDFINYIINKIPFIFSLDNRIDNINYKICQILIKNKILTRETALKLEQLYYKKGDYELAYTMHNFAPEKELLKCRATDTYKKYID